MRHDVNCPLAQPRTPFNRRQFEGRKIFRFLPNGDDYCVDFHDQTQIVWWVGLKETNKKAQREV